MRRKIEKNSVVEIFKLCESENIPKVVHQKLSYLYIGESNVTLCGW